ncbi:MAG: hypothetical protein HWQ36_25955 [Nostoc sp. NMS2]|uniref:LamG-like jellyroll fold domain-containing protein n=1 Tax=Nostoc sp. NMS2 TaxID=2815389 RepID=UPI0025FED9C2|nr:LamG-like jellyroll fold domain-containing protein [Nostoc sp. NMS2]MBN3993831.1 hypothetical protein [Nostoc sp. NMS2]
MVILGNLLIKGGSIRTDPYFSNVIFLSHFDTLTDIKGHAITNNGGVSLNTSDKYFGTASAQFSGASNSYLSIDDPASDFSLPDDFAIECFINFSSLGVTNHFHPILEIGNPISGGFRIGWYNDGSSSFFQTVINNTAYNSSFPFAPTTDTWYYFAFTRSSGVNSCSINGSELSGSFTNGYSISSGSSRLIGGSSLSSLQRFIGKIDEYRITKAVTRDVSVIPAMQFPNR